MDASAAKFRRDRLADPAVRGKQARNFKWIARVEVRDPSTFASPPAARIPHWMRSSRSGLTSCRRAPSDRGYDATHVARDRAGTGSSKFLRWRKDEEILVEADAACGRGAPAVRTVVFKPIPETATRGAALQPGEVDMAANIPPQPVAPIQWGAHLRISRAPSPRTIFIPIYTVKDDEPIARPVGGLRVRRAMLPALDVDPVIRDVLEGQVVRTLSMLTEPPFRFDPGLKSAPPDRARRLVAEAGYHNGVDPVLNSPDGRYIKDTEVAYGVAGQLT